MLRATRTIRTKNGLDIKYIYELDQEMSVIVTFGKIKELIEKMDMYHDDPRERQALAPASSQRADSKRSALFEDDHRRDDLENKFQNIAKAIVYSDNLGMLETLLQKYSFDISFEKSILLLIAIYNKSGKIIDFLLDQRINIDHCKEIVVNLPFYCLNEKLVKILLNNGVLDINHDDDILLFNACTNGTSEFIYHLLSMGANPTSRNGIHLVNTISIHDTAKMELLLNAGALVGANDGEPLFACIKCGYYEGAKLLINYGANIYTGKHGDPLLSCIKFGQAKILELFIKCGASINKTNARPIPISEEKEKLVDEIIKSGIDPYVVIKQLISDL